MNSGEYFPRCHEALRRRYPPRLSVREAWGRDARPHQAPPGTSAQLLFYSLLGSLSAREAGTFDDPNLGGLAGRLWRSSDALKTSSAELNLLLWRTAVLGASLKWARRKGSGGERRVCGPNRLLAEALWGNADPSTAI